MVVNLLASSAPESNGDVSNAVSLAITIQHAVSYQRHLPLLYDRYHITHPTTTRPALLVMPPHYNPIHYHQQTFCIKFTRKENVSQQATILLQANPPTPMK